MHRRGRTWANKTAETRWAFQVPWSLVPGLRPDGLDGHRWFHMISRNTVGTNPIQLLRWTPWAESGSTLLWDPHIWMWVLVHTPGVSGSPHCSCDCGSKQVKTIWSTYRHDWSAARLDASHRPSPFGGKREVFWQIPKQNCYT